MSTYDPRYRPSEKRYDQMPYRACGRSGLMLSAVSLGLWQNFGDDRSETFKRELCCAAFDNGITHFDNANVYGLPRGSTEEFFGRLMASDFSGLRDEITVATKAGYDMWRGPYGERCSRKHLVASCDASLARMGLDYVDIFYAHRFDDRTPVEETASALDYIVRSGRALYVGVSSYNSLVAQELTDALKSLGTPCIANQPAYNIFNRWVERDGLLDQAEAAGTGLVAFTPLCQGLLTKKYLGGVAKDSRAAQGDTLSKGDVSQKVLDAIAQLNTIAEARGQSLAQMSLAWVLKDARVASVLVGVSRMSQLLECVEAAQNTAFSEAELQQIDKISEGIDINPWADAVAAKPIGSCVQISG